MLADHTCWLLLGAPACSDNMFSSLVTAFNGEGKPKVVKFSKDGPLPPGSSELPEGTEAAAVHAICMRPNKVRSLP